MEMIKQTIAALARDILLDKEVSGRAYTKDGKEVKGIYIGELLDNVRLSVTDIPEIEDVLYECFKIPMLGINKRSGEAWFESQDQMNDDQYMRISRWLYGLRDQSPYIREACLRLESGGRSLGLMAEEDRCSRALPALDKISDSREACRIIAYFDDPQKEALPSAYYKKAEEYIITHKVTEPDSEELLLLKDVAGTAYLRNMGIKNRRKDFSQSPLPNSLIKHLVKFEDTFITESSPARKALRNHFDDAYIDLLNVILIMAEKAAWYDPQKYLTAKDKAVLKFMKGVFCAENDLTEIEKEYIRELKNYRYKGFILLEGKRDIYSSIYARLSADRESRPKTFANWKFLYGMYHNLLPFRYFEFDPFNPENKPLFACLCEYDKRKAVNQAFLNIVNCPGGNGNWEETGRKVQYVFNLWKTCSENEDFEESLFHDSVYIYPERLFVEYGLVEPPADLTDWSESFLHIHPGNADAFSIKEIMRLCRTIGEAEVRKAITFRDGLYNIGELAVSFCREFQECSREDRIGFFRIFLMSVLYKCSGLYIDVIKDLLKAHYDKEIDLSLCIMDKDGIGALAKAVIDSQDVPDTEREWLSGLCMDKETRKAYLERVRREKELAEKRKEEKKRKEYIEKVAKTWEPEYLSYGKKYALYKRDSDFCLPGTKEQADEIYQELDGRYEQMALRRYADGSVDIFEVSYMLGSLIKESRNPKYMETLSDLLNQYQQQNK